MNRKNEIINSIEKILGEHSAYEVFADWIRCMALAIVNSISPAHNQIWEFRRRHEEFIERSEQLSV